MNLRNLESTPNFIHKLAKIYSDYKVKIDIKIPYTFKIHAITKEFDKLNPIPAKGHLDV